MLMSPLESKMLSVYKTPWRLHELAPGRSEIRSDMGSIVFIGLTDDMRRLVEYANNLAEEANKLVRSAH